MRQFALCLVAVLVVTFSFVIASSAANYPTDPYDATYNRQKMTKQGGTYVNDGGVSIYRYVTDGQGRIRIESQPPNAGIITGSKPPKTITIFDYPNGETYILLEKQKLAMRSPLKQDVSQAPIDDKRIKELNGKALGADKRFGYPCHGFEYELNGVKTETWTSDELRCPIDTFTMNIDGSLDVMHLSKYSNATPSPDEFNVPRDFKVSSTQGAGKIQ
jgi:hypothetical protein